MQAHSQLLLVLDEYCDDKRAGRQMPWKMIGEKLYGEPAQRGYGFNYLELYVWVMAFLTQEEDDAGHVQNTGGLHIQFLQSTGHVITVAVLTTFSGTAPRRMPMRATIVVQRTIMRVTVLIHGACGVTIVEVPIGQPNVTTRQPRSASNSRGRPDDRRSRSGSQPRERSQPRGGSQPRDPYQKRGFTPERRPSMTSQRGRGQEHHQRRGFTPERRPSSASHRRQGPHKTPERRPSSGSARGLGSPSPVKQ